MKAKIIIVIIIILIMGAFLIPGRTKPIVDSNRKVIPESIAEMEKITLGGVDQWLLIRGHSTKNPVLLFLSGGPAASELGRVRIFNEELEKDFTLVVWEQRGCGKSYDSINPKDKLTVEQYVEDIRELTEYLKKRFDKEKIYLMGHSWGTIIGVEAAQKYPELFHAYIGSAQMVDVLESDLWIYNAVLEDAEKKGDTKYVEKLKKQGEPPYTGKYIFKPYATIFTREYTRLESPHVKSEEFHKKGDIMSFIGIPEYSLMDKINFFRGTVNTFDIVYPQLQDINFKKTALDFKIPVYILLGRHDYNAPFWISEEYFELLKAPKKELFWFEESGHGHIWSEADKFHDIMKNKILPETKGR